MTFMIILGAAAGVYQLWLMFRLATLALPVYVAIAAAFLLRDADYGYVSAIAAGLLAGAAIWFVANAFLAIARSPLLRLAIAALFAVPAGFAGYQLAYSVAELASADGAMLLGVSLAGAVATAAASWSSLSGPNAKLPPQLAETRPL
ncbi:hypothetical protein [Sphingopyxis sp.]|uniref:hypothetical protein n=1 Tax=Sphingopyxis sp. TaxID=1908224 RepID=UPI003BA9EBA0